MSGLLYDISTMSGTATADTTIAAVNIIITSLNRQGKRLVQCFVFSNIDIAVFRTVTHDLINYTGLTEINGVPGGFESLLPSSSANYTKVYISVQQFTYTSVSICL